MVRWIEGDAELARAVDAWGDVVGLDTEFIRTDTFYPVPGLYQIAAGDEVYLLDPLAIEDWTPFCRYLEDPGVTKVMHACQEDLELLYHHLGAVPDRLFDTQFANAYVAPHFSLSYANLVERRLGVELGKHETRSNWLRRPLSEDQVRYAVEDVTHLVPLYRSLESELAELERLPWFEADMVARSSYDDGAPEEYYRNMKKAWRLAPRELAVLRALTAWRERTARELDVPRNRVVWDEHLYTFARMEKLDESAIYEVLPRGVARRHSDPLIEHHERGRDERAPTPIDRPLTTSQGALVKSLRDVARSKARQLAMAQELLARKRDLEDCVRSYVNEGRLSEHYKGWRAGLVGADFESILERAR